MSAWLSADPRSQPQGLAVLHRPGLWDPLLRDGVFWSRYTESVGGGLVHTLDHQQSEARRPRSGHEFHLHRSGGGDGAGERLGYECGVLRAQRDLHRVEGETVFLSAEVLFHRYYAGCYFVYQPNVCLHHR